MPRTFRIFISSTFNDLKEERNALQQNVFPLLRELCNEHGYRFQAIDLRWGISNEASLNQKTMRICLEELRRCQETPSIKTLKIPLTLWAHGACNILPALSRTQPKPKYGM